MPNEIYVKVLDETSGASDNNAGSSESLTSQTQMRKQSPPSSETANNIRKTKAIGVAAMVGSRSLSYVSSNVGKWTGNSKNQTTANNIQQIVGIGAMAVVSWPVALATVGINMATTAIDTGIEQKWDKRQSQQNLARAGYNSKGELVGRRH